MLTRTNLVKKLQTALTRALAIGAVALGAVGSSGTALSGAGAVLGGAGAAASTLLLARPAGACSPCYCDVPGAFLPYLRDELAPRNVRFLIDLDIFQHSARTAPLEQSEFRWFEAESKHPVEFDFLPAGPRPTLVWAVPHEPLAPDTNYRFLAGTDQSPFLIQTFKTGTKLDEVPPQLPPPRLEAPERSSSCGVTNSAQLVWDELMDEGVGITYAPIVQARVQQGDQEVTLFLEAKNRTGGRHAVALNAPLDATSRECWGSSSLPSSEPRAVVTLTVFDLAGNATELAPLDVELGKDEGEPPCWTPEEGGYCELSPPRPARSSRASAYGLVLLGGAGLWRRQRARRNALTSSARALTKPATNCLPASRYFERAENHAPQRRP